MYNYSVESNKLIAKSILSLRLRAKSLDDVFAFTPGQYACLSFIHDGRNSSARCFSFASSPHDRGILEFGIKIEGDYTGSLIKLKSGDLIEIQGPFGNFLDETVRADEIVFFAGGIGITPFISAIRTAARLNFPQKITLLYSVRTFNDAAYINELANIQNSSPNFSLYLFLSKENAGAYNSERIISGQVTDAAINKILQNNFANKKFFICGPGTFMEAMRNNLVARKVASNNILTEEFSAAGNKQSGISSNRQITKWVTSGVIASFLLIALVDASQYGDRLKAAIEQNSATANQSSAPVTTSPNNSQNNYVSPIRDDDTPAPVQSPTSAATSQNSAAVVTPPSQTKTMPMTRVS